MSGSPERIVIYRLGSLGDTVVTLPGLHKVMERYPGAERIALTNFPISSKAAPLEAILGPGGFIHRAIRYPVGMRNPKELWALAKALRALKTDTMIYLSSRGNTLSSVYRNYVFFRLCGFRNIIGAPFTRDLLDTRTDPKTGIMEREAHRLARCLAALGPIDIEDPSVWDLHLTPEEHAAADAFLTWGEQPFIGLNTGGKDAEKDWGDDHWTELLAKLAPTVPYPLVFVGAPDDIARADRLGGLWPHGYLNGCGVLSPRQSGAVLQRARMFIGHDSGPVHLAGAVGTACVGLFGGFDPAARWHPVGAQHRILHENAGVRNITVDAVVAAVNEILDAR